MEARGGSASFFSPSHHELAQPLCRSFDLPRPCCSQICAHDLMTWHGVAKLPLTLLIYSPSPFKTYEYILRPRWYLRSIPSPPRVSFIEGNTRAVLESDPGAVHRQWHKAYGHTFRYDGLLSVCCFPFASGP